MNDLIERQAAIDAMCSACGYDCDKSEFVYDAPQDKQVIMCPEHYALTVLPPAQSKIIHCEHCKHGVHSGRGDTYLCVVSPEELGEHKYDFFCGYGERK